MTRATSTGERFAPGGFGDADRALVWRLSPGIWEGNRPDEGAGPQFPTWRAAMDYALGLDADNKTEEPNRDEDQGPAASCHLCVGAMGYEDYDGEWRDCSCQLDTPSETP